MGGRARRRTLRTAFAQTAADACAGSGHGWHFTRNATPHFVCVYCGSTDYSNFDGAPEHVEDGFIEERRRQRRYLRSLHVRKPHGKPPRGLYSAHYVLPKGCPYHPHEYLPCYTCNGGLRRR